MAHARFMCVNDMIILCSKNKLITCIFALMVYRLYMIVNMSSFKTVDYANAHSSKSTNTFRMVRNPLLLDRNSNIHSIQDLYRIFLQSQHKQTSEELNTSNRMLQQLTRLVEKRIEASQNPANCSQAKILVYRIGRSGYCSEMELLAKALLEAFYIGRTLIIRSKGWRYCKKGWEEHHLPLSKTCAINLAMRRNGDQYTDKNIDDKQVVYLGIGNIANPKVPAAIPSDIAPLLVKLHPHPQAWWQAQFIKYVSRLRPWVHEKVKARKRDLVMKQGFRGPVVGVQVRRTDKLLVESARIPVDEYMRQVGVYFQRLEREIKSVPARKIYLATDDTTVGMELRDLYPEYQIIVLTPTPSERTYPYRESDLMEIIMDLAFLTETNYTVCTFSSNICRRVYEFKQIYGDYHYPYSITSVYSLDVEYHMFQEYRIVIADCTNSNNSLHLKIVKGDIMKIIVTHKHFAQGMAYGMCERTNQTGIYPVNITVYYVKVSDFPTHGLHVDLI